MLLKTDYFPIYTCLNPNMYHKMDGCIWYCQITDCLSTYKGLKSKRYHKMDGSNWNGELSQYLWKRHYFKCLFQRNTLFLKKLDHCIPLRKKSPYSELFWSTFSRISPHSDWIRRDTPQRYSVRRGTPYLSVFSPNAGKCEKNMDQNNSECGHFLRSVCSPDILT